MRRRGASLIWCPTSNLAMLGRTVSRAVLRSGIPIALATDSALSAPVDLLDELAVARRYLPADRLYEMVTTVPARILRLPRATGRLDRGALAKLEQRSERCWRERSRWWWCAGRIRLISPDLARQLPAAVRRRLQLLHRRRTARPCWWMRTSARLRRAAAKHLGSDLRLAGKRMLS